MTRSPRRGSTIICAAWPHSGHTILFPSHVLSEVQDPCEHVAIVRDGRAVANEPLAELRRCPVFLAIGDLIRMLRT